MNTKERIIGVDYKDSLSKDNFYEINITVVEGIKAVYYKKMLIKRFEELFPELVLLSLKYDAKINYENNLNRIYCLFASHNAVHMLRENSIPKMIEIHHGRKQKGFTYVKYLQELFNKYSDLLIYEKEFEDSYRVAVLPILYDKTTQYRFEEIKCLERKLKELKDLL